MSERSRWAKYEEIDGMIDAEPSSETDIESVMLKMEDEVDADGGYVRDRGNDSWYAGAEWAGTPARAREKLEERRRLIAALTAGWLAGAKPRQPTPPMPEMLPAFIPEEVEECVRFVGKEMLLWWTNERPARVRALRKQVLDEWLADRGIRIIKSLDEDFKIRKDIRELMAAVEKRRLSGK